MLHQKPPYRVITKPARYFRGSGDSLETCGLGSVGIPLSLKVGWGPLSDIPLGFLFSVVRLNSNENLARIRTFLTSVPTDYRPSQ